MENMSRVPYLLDRVRTGYRMGHGTLVDAMYQDGFSDPLSGKIKWRTEFKYPPLASLLSTKGNLVFVPGADGNFHALDARTGKELWKNNNGIGHHGGVISYMAGGKQYIAVVAGWGSHVSGNYGPLFGHPFTEIGVPSYPEGHVDIADERLLEVLLEKQRYAHYMATQMCFNPRAIVSWIARMRAEGVTMAVHLGTPGVADLTKLMTISARIGIADSARYLKKNRKMVGSLLTPGKFGPDALLLGMADAFCDPDARIEALHLFTFNQVAATLEWQQRMLAELG